MSARKTIAVPLSIDDLKVFKFDDLPKPIGEGSVHCPRCGLPGIKNGSTRKYSDGKPRIQKYRCPHNHSFNENTSLEAMYSALQEQRDILHLVLRGEVEEAIAIKLDVSKYKIKQVIESVANLLEVEEIDEIKDTLIVMFIDESSAGARSRCLISALVGNHIVSYIADGRNFLTIKSALESIKKALGDVYDKKIIVVTDGYEAYVDAVFTVFPGAIHVRQFHSKRGVVYIHYVKGGEKRTIVLRWDAFLNSKDGKVSENTLRKRKWSRKMRKEMPPGRRWIDKVKAIDTPLESYDDAYYYKGFKRHPVARRSGGGKRRRSRVKRGKRTKRKGPKVVLLFKGKLDELVKRFDDARETIEAVRGVFAGKYITSNMAEYTFQFKPWLKTRHGLKDATYVFVMMLGYVLGTVGNDVRSEEVANHIFGASPIL